MPDSIITSGDQLKVTFLPPTLIPMLASSFPLVGTSTNVLVGGKAACLEGDELPKALNVPLPYVHIPPPAPVTPGVGRLKLILKPDNKTLLTKNGKAILIKGGLFIAIFNVTTPAQQITPGGPVSDTLMVKNGTAQFITTNVLVKAG